MYEEEKKRRSQGFQQKKVLAVALDLRTKWLYVIGAHEHDKVLNIVFKG